MIDKLEASLRFNRESLNLRAQRQEVLAANIANADTPDYKARDIDFASALSRAVEQGRSGGGVALATTSARHVVQQGLAATSPELLFRTPAQASIDGNTVEMDAERVSFADNALRYEAGLTVVSAKIKSLLAALQG